jgi:hypothetical protein
LSGLKHRIGICLEGRGKCKINSLLHSINKHNYEYLFCTTFNLVSLVVTKLATPNTKGPSAQPHFIPSHSLKQSTLYLARRCKSHRIFRSVSSKFFFKHNVERYYKYPLFIFIYILVQNLHKYNKQESINN